MQAFYEIAERAFAKEAAGERVIRLNVGDSFLPTPACAIDAAVRSLRDEKATYGPAMGLLSLRERIAVREGCHVDQVVVGPGSKHLLFGLVSVLRKRVAVPTPCWPAYELICSHAGVPFHPIETTLTRRWQLDVDAIDLSEVGALILCNPCNPTSTIYEERSVRALLDKANQTGTQVILDEAYRGVSFETIPSYPAIRVRSFSKEFSMEGWRLGYALVPAGMASRLQSFLHVTTTCVPLFTQRAALAVLDQEQALRAQAVAIWKRRAEAATDALRRRGFSFCDPQAAMYVFATHPLLDDAEQYALRLVQRGVVVAPGTGFGDYRRFVRVCFNQQPAVLEEAVELMAQTLPGAGEASRANP